jgi:hypothetical protein
LEQRRPAGLGGGEDRHGIPAGARLRHQRRILRKRGLALLPELGLKLAKIGDLLVDLGQYLVIGRAALPLPSNLRLERAILSLERRNLHTRPASCPGISGLKPR